jgi:GST-like protein
MTHRLLAHPGWGSAIVEALFALAGVPCEIEDLDPAGRAADRERLVKLNPLAQVPTLVLPDGSVMTESAAMALYAADLGPLAGLIPPPGSAARPHFQRWLVFIVANIYATFATADHPEQWVSSEAAQKELLEGSRVWRERYWKIIEDGIAPRPWFLGDRLTALDVFVAVMTRWAPRREWFKSSCPKLFAIAQAVDAEPRLAKVWQRNFP